MQSTPKQARLLGAKVCGLSGGAVSSTLTFYNAIVEAPNRVNHRVALTDLRRDEVVFPAAP